MLSTIPKKHSPTKTNNSAEKFRLLSVEQTFRSNKVFFLQSNPKFFANQKTEHGDGRGPIDVLNEINAGLDLCAQHLADRAIAQLLLRGTRSLPVLRSPQHDLITAAPSGEVRRTCGVWRDI
jgi:hypothetical protein